MAQQIDVGEAEPRTIVSGLVKFVPLEKMQVGVHTAIESDTMAEHLMQRTRIVTTLRPHAPPTRTSSALTPVSYRRCNAFR